MSHVKQVIDQDVIVTNAVDVDLSQGAGTTDASTLRVVIATDQTNLPVAAGAYSKSNTPIRLLTSSTNIPFATYLEVVSSTSLLANAVHFFNGTGFSVILAFGSSGSEVDQFIFPPSGDVVPLRVPAGTRLTLKAFTADITTGEVVINLIG
jgi:hypothetical protein